jgi:hypothetical protein
MDHAFFNNALIRIIMILKFLAATLLIALLSFACGLYFQWWVIAPVSFVVSLLIPQRPLAAFMAGFLALFLLWGGLALAIDLANGSILSAKVAAILPLGGSSYAIVIVTGLVGALVGGGSALTAAFLKKTS